MLVKYLHCRRSDTVYIVSIYYLAIVGKTKVEHAVVSIVLDGVKGDSTIPGQFHHRRLGAGRTIANIHKDHLQGRVKLMWMSKPLTETI